MGKQSSKNMEIRIRSPKKPKQKATNFHPKKLITRFNIRKTREQSIKNNNTIQ